MANIPNINYILVGETAKDLCEKYGKNIKEMEDWEISELLDQFIDEHLYP